MFCLFQSHAGSIEAITWDYPVSPEQAGFNPTLVRLRLMFHLLKSRQRSPFQSHAGSIEAIRIRIRSDKGHYGFNPTLVRLRQDHRRGRQRP